MDTTETLNAPPASASIALVDRALTAPLTRSDTLNNVPNELMALYYSQRADADLIITEGVSPSPNGLGYAHLSGIYSEAQVEGWKKITTAVHEKGGRIFVQLMHTGRIGHPKNLPKGARLVAPSSVKPQTTKMWVDGEGLMEIPAPEALTSSEVRLVIEEHIVAARNALSAGFDGVELHGANGHLINQFLNPNVNRRTDAYGGSLENRSRFLLELTEGVAAAIGNDKVGVRLSPFSEVNETRLYPEAEATHLHLASALNRLNIAYLHITDQAGIGHPPVLAEHLRRSFANAFILSGSYTANNASQVSWSKQADALGFGTAFSNLELRI